MSDDEKNPFKKGMKNEDWPEEVMKRFQMQAERTSESVEKVTQSFIQHITDTYACDDWRVEDEDLLLDWSEGFFTADRRSTVSCSGSNLVTYVG